MQTKYKMQPYERQQAIAIVKAYKAYKTDVLSEEKSILFLNGGKYETIGDERAFQPHGKGGKSAPTEDKALRLQKLHESYKARCVQAVEYALASLPIKHYTPELQKKVRQALFTSCVKGRYFRFEYSALDGIGRATFYRIRNQFLFEVIEKIKFCEK